jgi:hypothetical protein
MPRTEAQEVFGHDFTGGAETWKDRLIAPSPLADRQMVQGLRKKRFRNRRIAVKPFRLSVAIALALALIFAPRALVFADQPCDMLGRSASQAKNCHGCCQQMKCCPVSKQEEKAQSTLPTASNRADSGFGNILAISSKDSVLRYSCSGSVGSYRSFGMWPPAPVTLSLARLCIRLI